MSFLATVLQTAETIEIEKISNEIQQLETDINTSHEKLMKKLENFYLNRNELPRPFDTLSEQIQHLYTQMEENHKKLIEYKRENQLNPKLKAVLTVSWKLCQIHDGLMEIDVRLLPNKPYNDYVTKFELFDRLVNEIDENSGVVSKELLNEIKIVVVTEKSSFLSKLNRKFMDNVVVLVDGNVSKLKIRKSFSIEAEKVLKCLFLSQSSFIEDLVNFFKKFLTESVDFVVRDYEEGDFNVLELKSNNNTGIGGQELFENLLKIEDFLQTNLSNDRTLVELVKKELEASLIDLIKGNRLIISEEDFSTIFKQLDKNLLNESTKTKNPGNEHLILAKKLMMENIKDTQTLKLNKNDDKTTITISKYILELIDLIKLLLKEPELELEIARNIVKLFTIFRPAFYDNNFKSTNPKDIAIFYNNFHYFSEKLTEINQTKKQAIFLDESYQLKKISAEYFQKFIENEIEQLLNNFKRIQQTDWDLFEKFAQVSLNRLNNLKQIWSEFLFNETLIYEKSLGFVLMSVLNYFIDYVIQFEQISNGLSCKLVVLFKQFQLFGNCLQKYVTNWDKFADLIFILDSNLIAINEVIIDGNLRLSSLELKRLIEAILTENCDLKRKILEKFFTT